MRKKEKVIFLDFKEVKEFVNISHEKRIVDVYMDKDNDRIVIEIEPGTRFHEGTTILDLDKSIQYSRGKEFNRDRQLELRRLHGKVVRKELL